jgi:hypothetical protein
MYIFQNKYNLAAEHSFTIQLEDVNDKFPMFSKEINSGLVLENEPPGAPVMQVSAVDADVTPQFKKVRLATCSSLSVVFVLLKLLQLLYGKAGRGKTAERIKEVRNGGRRKKREEIGVRQRKEGQREKGSEEVKKRKRERGR